MVDCAKPDWVIKSEKLKIKMDRQQYFLNMAYCFTINKITNKFTIVCGKRFANSGILSYIPSGFEMQEKIITLITM
jgi:hypothetical protein